MKNIVYLLIITFSTLAFSQNTSKRISTFNLENKEAIKGYDPVAYFKQNKAIKGKKDITTVYEGIRYHFSSKENEGLFLKNPSHYEPQYGGWCAYAMGSSGDKVEINPETFKIINGELYLYYNAFLNNTLKSWNKDEKKLKNKADNNWKDIYK